MLGFPSASSEFSASSFFFHFQQLLSASYILSHPFAPYQNGFCHANASELTAQIQSYTNVTSGDAEALKLALFKNGPVAVSIDASHRSFVFYSYGVYYEPACGEFRFH